MSNNEFTFECPDLTEGATFPLRYTGRGEDFSPEFILHNVAVNAQTIAITLDDIKHPIFKTFNHWLIWNLPVQDRIPEHIPAGKILPELGNAKQGVAYGRHHYAGPKPPRGKQHAYRFTIYILDCELELKPSARKKDFLKESEPHLLQKSELTGLFE
ncbi:YbhB/YbcL family Raf kinase inhibitor-like protein [Xylocopilactobacillus apis]|uniref:YbhB/YbcL family Raf kinase inhibitor-like protein n=1 Tax=Xylocopilactobacillus apis TaxID=2932183 RepID=A0AAU9D6P0_9LACO|nr:YbhB/YbcL family Raf kinase inhibitor-like protein [Xylocopilactobacillus apis]BDR57085.1 hypothetical protein KIMC2_16470 [Xylocopilactobacillus apis]